MAEGEHKMNYCEYIHEVFNSVKKIRFPFGRIPLNGIYILFEAGESAHSAERIVSAGTHTGDDNLRNRLEEHFVKEKKDRSIFRRNIGRAILNKNQDPFLDFWDLDLTTRKARNKYTNQNSEMEKQKDVEKEVTTYIRNNFSFITIEIEDKATRLELKSKIISTVSLCERCKPSETWLGNYSPKEKIRESGLWVVNDLGGTPLNDEDIKYLESKIG
jgi:hypothetical protein